MLTCKEVANLVLSLNVSLTLEDQLDSEKERARRDELDEDFEFGSDTVSDYEDALALMDEEFEGRIDAQNAQSFLHRLDKGWNRSQNMLCNHCNKFVPNSEAFWESKKQTYFYKSNNKAARGYRIIRDCACKCTPDEIIEKWVNREDRLRGWDYSQCPECSFYDTGVTPPACKNCVEASNFDDFGLGCGCPDCDCYGCGCHGLRFMP
jgi:hypothetical protein